MVCKGPLVNLILVKTELLEDGTSPHSSWSLKTEWNG